MNSDKNKPEGKEAFVACRLPVIPLRDMVMTPAALSTVFMSRPVSVEAAQNGIRFCDSRVILLTQRDKQVDAPEEKDLYAVGVVGEIRQLLRLPDGSVKALVRGTVRVRVSGFDKVMKRNSGEVSHFTAFADPVPTLEISADELSTYHQNLMKLLEEYAKTERKFPEDIVNQIRTASDLVLACDLAFAAIQTKAEEAIQFLELESPAERYELVLGILTRLLQTGQIDKRIQMRVKSQMEKNQREYYLNEQMKAIRKELGRDGEDQEGEFDDVTALERRVKDAQLPKEVEDVALTEVRRLRMMPPSSSEAAVVRGYVETLIDVPWTRMSEVNQDIQRAREVLEADHWGLEKVKERILEYLAVQKRVGKVKSPILCLVGGPGVGKTSLGRSIARATNREYIRMALGGISDEAEIRGHRRTYVGAMPGQVMKHMIKAGVRNPLFLLDEIDKVGTHHRGDPSAALLEVLDPEQNNTFEDHYIETPYDLSDVLFVATSNSYNIPPALLDRMEVISLEGYSEDEKVHIAERHLIPKQLEANGVRKEEVTISEAAVRDIIRYYTREAGVRALERSIGKILRKIVLSYLEETDAKKVKLPIAVTPKNLGDFLGIRRYNITESLPEPKVGLVNGLSWSEVGGDILMIEAVSFPGKGQVVRTGMLGDVMKESIEAARSVVRARADSLGLKSDVFSTTDWHIHFPEGAIPKDGPSAGAAIVTAMVSSLTKIPVRSDLAMTGEITLRGEVLPIGGLKEKLLAALRGGVKTVLIPSENEKDLSEIPEDYLKGLEILLVKNIDEVLRVALVDAPKPLEGGKPLEPLPAGGIRRGRGRRPAAKARPRRKVKEDEAGGDEGAEKPGAAS